MKRTLLTALLALVTIPAIYVPAPWLQKGTNEIIIFDLIHSATLPHVAGLDHPILDSPVSDQTTSPQQ